MTVPPTEAFDVRIEARVAPLERLGRVGGQTVGIEEKFTATDGAREAEIQRIVGPRPGLRTRRH